ncbi:MAG TPA: hypothetical protein VMW69_02330 [Spirochaetia bacterium]|nr:hypothetical protein [Spirochaetia bacterium]
MVSRTTISTALFMFLVATASCGMPLDCHTRIESRLEAGGDLSEQLSLSLPIPGGEVYAYLRERLETGAFENPEWGLSTPSFDLGGLEEYGLLRELGRPLGLASMREACRVTLCRSMEGSSVEGGVIRLISSSRDGDRVDLYGVERGGSAPPGTRSGGMALSTQIFAPVRVSAAAKVTAFGTEEVEAGDERDWFSEIPQVKIPVLTRLGARIGAGFDYGEFSLNGGVALSQRTLPAGFLSGYAGLRGRYPLSGDGALPHSQASVSARIAGGVLDPTYVGDDARYPTRVVVFAPALSIRLSGLALSGSYTYALGRLPLIPVVNREQRNEFTFSTSLDLPLIRIGAALSEGITFTEEGRTLLRRTTTLRSSLHSGCASFDGELALRHANDSEDCEWMRLAAVFTGPQTHWELWARARESSLSLGAECTALHRESNLHIAVELGELVAFDMRRMHLTSPVTLAEGAGRVSFTISWGAGAP